ncbi:CBL-interacting protein kinase 14 [Zea mays]|uniref:non-specific serine/threonine protein kinase n=1 Tax=Zea mays TaxID=4577 RepID=A0A3L6GCV1_MAIZE|nr:CBL-interacting protein kinase 14 [Zea mays]
MGKLLGKGAFGKVHYARDLESNQGVAIKIMDKDRVLKAGLSEQVKREITTMRLVEHKNIVRLHEVMATRNKIYIIMEYAKGGELLDKVKRSGRLTEADTHRYFQQLIGALDHCHSRGVYHRDLKPENLLLDENGDLKCIAPEVIKKTGYDGAKSDIWSCGVVLFVLAAGYLPFQGPNMMEIYRKIHDSDFRCPSWFSHKLKRLLYKILNPNPSMRPSIQEIKESTWFRKGPREISAMKEKVLSENATATNAAPVLAARRKEIAHEDKTLVATKLNAFEIIAFSAGLDLSGLFIKECRKETRFTSDKPALAIISKLEDVAKALNLRIRKKDNNTVIIQGRKHGGNGVLQFDTQIFEITPSCHLVQMKQTSGDLLEYQKLLEEGIRPGLKDVVWAWHGDDLQQK